jgi:hypothetical protein
MAGTDVGAAMPCRRSGAARKLKMGVSASAADQTLLQTLLAVMRDPNVLATRRGKAAIAAANIR